MRRLRKWVSFALLLFGVNGAGLNEGAEEGKLGLVALVCGSVKSK